VVAVPITVGQAPSPPEIAYHTGASSLHQARPNPRWYRPFRPVVGVAQLVELLVVVQAVGGSSPLAHPSRRNLSIAVATAATPGVARHERYFGHLPTDGEG
jgi:hypothetical protein